METIKKVLKYLPWVFLVVGGILFVRQCNEKKVPTYVPVEVIVEVPSVEKVFDTIYEPVPVIVREVDSTYYEEYKKLKDSVQKDSMFREAITIREYKETFEDTLQTINVYSKTRGTLLSQTVDYKTKPYTIVVKDSVEVELRRKVSFGAEVGIPTVPTLDPAPIIKGGLTFTNKKGNTFSLGYDTEGRAWIGKSWVIKLRLRD